MTKLLENCSKENATIIIQAQEKKSDYGMTACNF